MPDDSPTTITHVIGSHGHVRVEIGPGDVEVTATDDRDCQVIVTYRGGTADTGRDPVADGVIRVERLEGQLVDRPQPGDPRGSWVVSPPAATRRSRCGSWRHRRHV